jgi:hypothetical protein
MREGSRRTVVVAVTLALIGSGARAQGPAACAKFDDPLAYNACLARGGPPAHATRAITPAQDAAPGAHARSAMRVAHGRRGRMVLELSVGEAPARRLPK